MQGGEEKKLLTAPLNNILLRIQALKQINAHPARSVVAFGNKVYNAAERGVGDSGGCFAETALPAQRGPLVTVMILFTGSLAMTTFSVEGSEVTFWVLHLHAHWRTLWNPVRWKKLFLPISWQWSQRYLRLVYLHHRNLVGNGFVLLHPSSPSAVANNRLCDRNTDLSHSHRNDASTLRQIQVKGKVCVYLRINLCQAGWRGRAQCMGDKHQIMVWPISFSIALLGHYHRNGPVGLSGSYMQEYAPRALLST